MRRKAGVQVVALLLMMIMSSVDSLAQKRISL